MAQDKLKIGIIGTGGIAQIAHIPIWMQMENVDLVAICDRNKNRAKWIAEKYGIGRYFERAEEMLKIDEIVAVDICTPTQSHMPLAISAISAGKHVLVEKPMARNYEESVKMVDCAREHQRILMVAMNVRFRQDAMTLKTFTQKGELGEIFYGKTGWLRTKESLVHRTWLSEKEVSGGGVFMDLGIQMLDVGLWLMGNPHAVSVSATTYNKISQLPVEDSAAAFIRLSEGSTLTVEVSWTLLSEKDFFYTNLFGTRGGALLNPLRVHRELHGNLVNVTPPREETPENLYKKSYQNELRHFADCLLSGETPSSSGEENLERMRIADAVYESARSGREVLLK